MELQEVYAAECAAFSLKQNSSVSSTLASIDPTQCVKLALSTYLGKRGGLPLANVLAQMPELVSLELSGAGLGDESCSAVCSALTKSEKFAKLDLTDNELTPESVQPLSRLIFTTGASVRLSGNKAMFQSSIEKLAALSVAVQSRLPLEKSTVHHKWCLQGDIPIQTLGQLPFDASLSIMKRRIVQEENYAARARVLRRVDYSPEGDTWLSIGLHVACPYEMFDTEISFLRECILPAVNRRLRDFKAVFHFTAFHKVAQESSSDGVLARSTDVRRFAVSKAADALVVFRNNSLAQTVLGDCAERARVASGGPAEELPLLCYTRKTVRDTPTSFLSSVNGPRRSTMAEWDLDDLNGLGKALKATVPQCCSLEYEGKWFGVSPRGDVSIGLPEQFAATVASDLFVLGADFRKRASKYHPRMAPLASTSLTHELIVNESALEMPSLVSQLLAVDPVQKPVVALYSAPGGGKSYQLDLFERYLLGDANTCAVVRVNARSMERSLDQVCFELLRKLGATTEFIEAWRLDQDTLDDDFVLCKAFAACLRRYKPPTFCKNGVTLLVDDADCVPGPGLRSLSRLLPSELRCVGDLPVRIVFTVTATVSASGALHVDGRGVEGDEVGMAVDPSELPRLFIEHIRVPPLDERQTVHLLLHRLWKQHRQLRSPKALAAAQKAGAHLALQKPDSPLPLYVTLAADEVAKSSEEVSMISIADQLPGTLDGMLDFVIEPLHFKAHTTTLLRTFCAVGQRGIRGDLLRQFFERSLNPLSVPRSKWGHLLPSVTPSAQSQRLFIDAVASAPLCNWLSRPEISVWREPFYFDSKSVDDAIRVLFADKETSKLRSRLEQLIMRFAAVGCHRFAGDGLRLLPVGGLTTLLSPQLISSFLATGQRLALQRVWQSESRACLVHNQRLGSRFKAYTQVLERHWHAVSSHPGAIFTLVTDTSPICDGFTKLELSKTPSGRTAASLDSDVIEAFESVDTAYLERIGVTTATKPRPSNNNTVNTALPLGLKAWAQAVFVFLQATDKTPVESVGTQEGLQHDLCKAGELVACAPPTFALNSDTCARLTTHDSPISDVVVEESTDVLRCRAAVLAWRDPTVVIVACWRAECAPEGRLELAQVAKYQHPTLRPFPSAIALGGGSNAVGNSRLEGLWAPGVAVASEAVVVTFAPEENGSDPTADPLLIQQDPLEPMVFTGHSGVITCLDFSPGGAMLVGIDTTGLVIMWGSVDCPCPGLILSQLVVNFPVNKLVFALPDTTLLITDDSVLSWECNDGLSRPVLISPTKTAFGADGFSVVRRAQPAALAASFAAHVGSAGRDARTPSLMSRGVTRDGETRASHRSRHSTATRASRVSAITSITARTASARSVSVKRSMRASTAGVSPPSATMRPLLTFLFRDPVSGRVTRVDENSEDLGTFSYVATDDDVRSHGGFACPLPPQGHAVLHPALSLAVSPNHGTVTPVDTYTARRPLPLAYGVATGPNDVPLQSNAPLLCAPVTASGIVCPFPGAAGAEVFAAVAVRRRVKMPGDPDAATDPHARQPHVDDVSSVVWFRYHHGPPLLPVQSEVQYGPGDHEF